jgi:hypothetical protein
MSGRHNLSKLSSRIEQLETRVKGRSSFAPGAARDWLINKFEDMARKRLAEDDARDDVRLAEAVADLVGDCPPEELEERLRELANGRPAHDR